MINRAKSNITRVPQFGGQIWYVDKNDGDNANVAKLDVTFLEA